MNTTPTAGASEPAAVDIRLDASLISRDLIEAVEGENRPTVAALLAETLCAESHGSRGFDNTPQKHLPKAWLSQRS